MASPPTELDVLRRLHELNLFMGSSLDDVQQLLDRVLNDIMDLLAADFGNIQLYDPAAESLKIVSYRNFKRPFLDYFATVGSGGASACAQAMLSGQRVVIEDVEKDPSYAPHLGAAREAGYRSVQSTPMFGPLGELIGIISTHGRKPRQFADRELWLADLYARQAGFAIGAKRANQALRKEQERQKHLLAELQHRVRNTLSVIRSIVRRTGVTSDSKDEFELQLNGRLASFARTQAYVTRDPDGGTALDLIVRDELMAHAQIGSRSIIVEGPEVRLSAKQAETMGLAIHELTSNAIRHGALADAGNSIRVKWRVNGKGEARRLHFHWVETLKERRLTPPDRQGFGTELLEGLMRYDLTAEPTLDFRPEGLSYRVSIPLPVSPASH